MIHGGDIYRNKITHDFSVNVNPLGMPDSVQSALKSALECCGHYPDYCALELKEAIAQMTGGEVSQILVGNGASELLMAAVHAVKPEKILIPVPSFYGYEWAAGEREILFYPMKKEEDFQLTERFLERLTGEIGMVFLANPNNPVGNVIKPALLDEILRRCKRYGIYVVLDECFLEFTECWKEITCRNRLDEFPNLLVVSAFTKTYAIPGVRLGYLQSGNADVLVAIARQLPEWNTSVFAQKAGAAAAKEKDFLEQTRRFLNHERRYLLEALTQEEIRVYPSETDFFLLYTKLPLYDELLARGALIRDCANFRGLGEGYYRVAVRTRGENRWLLAQIREICGNGRKGG